MGVWPSLPIENLDLFNFFRDKLLKILTNSERLLRDDGRPFQCATEIRIIVEILIVINAVITIYCDTTTILPVFELHESQSMPDPSLIFATP